MLKPGRSQSDRLTLISKIKCVTNAPTLRANLAISDNKTALLSNQCRDIEKFTDIANTLLARDYKGFGNQPMNGIIERN